MPLEFPWLVVWSMSGSTAEQKGFQKALQHYWNQYGGTGLSLPMSHSSKLMVGYVAGVRNTIKYSLVNILNFLADLFK